MDYQFSERRLQKQSDATKYFTDIHHSRLEDGPLIDSINSEVCELKQQIISVCTPTRLPDFRLTARPRTRLSDSLSQASIAFCLNNKSTDQDFRETLCLYYLKKSKWV